LSINLSLSLSLSLPILSSSSSSSAAWREGKGIGEQRPQAEDVCRDLFVFNDTIEAAADPARPRP